MTSKNIVFTKPAVAELLEEKVAELQQNQVLVKLNKSVISSGTERANLLGDDTLAWNSAPMKAVFPRRLGYSSSGVVMAVGEAVTDLKEGDRVAVAWGTHSQYLIADSSNVYKIGDIPFSEAAMFNIATFPLAAIRKCRLEIGESAIVMGMGVLGLCGIKLLKAAGAVPVIAVDPSPEKREKAIACGADHALDPYAEDFVQTVKNLTGGGANVGIEVTGVGAGLNGILDCMARFGRVALLGCTRKSDFTVDYYRKVHGPGITLVGAHTMARPDHESSGGWWTQRDDFATLAKLVANERLSLADMIEETHSPLQATEIFTRLANEKAFPIVEFDWSALK